MQSNVRIAWRKPLLRFAIIVISLLLLPSFTHATPIDDSASTNDPSSSVITNPDSSDLSTQPTSTQSPGQSQSQSPLQPPTQPPPASQATTSPSAQIRPPLDKRPRSSQETAEARDAPTLPTYNLTHPAGTSRPKNLPPMIPNPPPFEPVKPTKHGALDVVRVKLHGGNLTSIVDPAVGPSGEPSQPVDDDSDVVTSDDPHDLPIPKSVTIPSGFPQPQRELGDQQTDQQQQHSTPTAPTPTPAPMAARTKHSSAAHGVTKEQEQQEIAPNVPQQQPQQHRQRQRRRGQPQQQEHDPLVHITAPPSGGWRAGDLREREQKMQDHQDDAKKTSTDGGGKTDQKPSNSYISPHGPSESFRRNQSQWMAPPDLQGPMPKVDPETYKPVEAPQYWMPDEAHIAALDAARALRRNKRVHTHGAGARTTRLVSADQGEKSPRVVEIRNNMLFADGEPFWIQGICYSPVPIGESVSFSPKGDYFTPDYAYIWQRDLPLIKAMGATTLRIYGWAAEADHTAFLDAVHAAGLKVLVTFYLGDATQNPVSTVDQRNQILINFVEQVHRYSDHPGILMWSFGNELNGAWNGFAKQFSDAFSCWWQAGCAGYSDTSSDCHWQSSCMYYQLFSWINAACKAAKIVTTRPIISGFADVDYMVGPTPWLDKVARFNYVLPDMDAWAVQLYRGWTFGGYFGMYRGESWKPMIVTEFGVDAYNDACGWPENNQGGCFNMLGDSAGGAEDNGHFWGCAGGGECGKPGVQAQAEWDVRLAQELMNQYVDRGGIVWGGFLMAWTDEWWKGGGTQDLCAYPCATWDAAWCRGGGIANYRPGGSAMCSWKAHFTCPNFDTNYHDLCGYWLAAAPDNYVNEEWFGITAPINCGLHKINPDGVDGGYKLNSLYVRPAYLQVMQLWSGNAEVDTTHSTCDSLKPCWSCCTTYSLDDLNDGACEKECAIVHLAVGPGSSVPQVEKSIGSALLQGPDSADSWWEKFGLPISIGLGIIGLAFLVSIFLYHKRKVAKAEALQPLLQQQ